MAQTFETIPEPVRSASNSFSNLMFQFSNAMNYNFNSLKW